MAKNWLNRGQTLVGQWSNTGRTRVKHGFGSYPSWRCTPCRPGPASLRANAGHTLVELVKHGSNTGQTRVKHWSSTGSSPSPAARRPAAAFQTACGAKEGGGDRGGRGGGYTLTLTLTLTHSHSHTHLSQTHNHTHGHTHALTHTHTHTHALSHPLSHTRAPHASTHTKVQHGPG